MLAHIDHAIEQHLARYPKKPIDGQLGCLRSLTHAVRFDLRRDEEEIRVHFIARPIAPTRWPLTGNHTRAMKLSTTFFSPARSK
jgi:hypothetical protein